MGRIDVFHINECLLRASLCARYFPNTMRDGEKQTVKMVSVIKNFKGEEILKYQTSLLLYLYFILFGRLSNIFTEHLSISTGGTC